MADVFAFGALEFGTRFAGFEVPAKRTNVIRWRDQIAARPSASA